jgi:hypothetical protein
VAEILVQFSDPLVTSDGTTYIARACGSEMADGLWQGWIEFLPVGDGEAVRSRRETTQPNRDDALYWATGLTTVYLEGALDRALNPPARPVGPPVAPPEFDGPAQPETPVEAVSDSILNPFSVYRKGQTLLRNQLAALSPWHLANIIRAYDLSDLDAETLEQMRSESLVEIIVTAVRNQAHAGTTR